MLAALIRQDNGSVYNHDKSTGKSKEPYGTTHSFDEMWIFNCLFLHSSIDHVYSWRTMLSLY